jgi:hypothetical protein
MPSPLLNLRSYNPLTYLITKIKLLFAWFRPRPPAVPLNPTYNTENAVSLRDFLNKYSDTLVGFGMINIVYKTRDHLDPAVQYKLLKEIKNYLDLSTPLWMDFLDEESYTELERLNHARKHVCETLDDYIAQIPKISQSFGKKVTPVYPFRLESLLGKNVVDFTPSPEDTQGTVQEFLRVHRIIAQYNQFLNGIESYINNREGLLMQLQEYQEYLSYLDNAHEVPKSCRVFFNDIIKKLQRNVNAVTSDLASPQATLRQEKMKLLAKTVGQEEQITSLKRQLEETQKQLKTQTLFEENALNKWDEAFTLELLTRHMQLRSFLKEHPGISQLKSYLTSLQEEVKIPANYNISAELKCREAMSVLQKHISELWLLLNLDKWYSGETSNKEKTSKYTEKPAPSVSKSPPGSPRLPANTSSVNTSSSLSHNNTEVSTLTSFDL